MRQDKVKAVALRKAGKSYKEITEILGIPKCTLAYWFKDEDWSDTIKHRLLKIARKNARKRMIIMSHKARRKRMELYRKNRLLAKEKFNEYKDEKLFNAGLMVYWGEGDGNLKNGMIRVTNTDPSMIKMFHIFLKRYLPEIYDKVKVYLILYPDLNDIKSKNFWSKKIGIPLNKFIKSQYIKGRHPTKRLLHGVCTIVICSRGHKEIIHQWINLVKKKIDAMRV